MEAFRTETGWGLAGIWGMVHRGEYERARARFDTLLAEHRHAFGTGSPAR